MNLYKLSLVSFLLALILVLNACEREDDKPLDNYSSGVFVTNEGGTVDHYNRTIGGIKNNIYGIENNGATLGGSISSIGFNGDTAYIVVSSANKLAMVSYKTFKSIGNIEGLTTPRYFVNINATYGYISDWGTDGLTGTIKVLDNATKKVARTVPIGKGTDEMLKIGNSVWVINNGGQGKDSTLVIVNALQDTILKRIQVGANPNSIVQDINGDIWVLCGGNNNVGKLIKIRNYVIEYSFDVPQGAKSLALDDKKSNLYFIADNKIYKKDLYNFGATTPSVFLSPAYFVKPNIVGFDTQTGYMYCGDAKEGKSEGKLYIYNPSTKAVIDSVKTGVTPNKLYFF